MVYGACVTSVILLLLLLPGVHLVHSPVSQHLQHLIIGQSKTKRFLRYIILYSAVRTALDTLDYLHAWH